MKNFKKLLSSQSGVSLIEVTAAAAISVIISLGIMKTNETGQKGMTKVTTDMDFKLWQANVLQRHLGNPDVCRDNFGKPTTQASVPQTLTTVVDGQTPTPQPFFVGGNNIPGTGGSWDAISMTRGAFLQDGSSDTLGRCILTVRARRTKKSFGPEIREINIPMSCTRATASPTSQIRECTITSDGSDTLWTQKVAVDGNPEYIYNASTVLVGPEAAAGELKARLEISDSNGIEFPAAASGVETSVRITNQNHALVFNDSGALYEGTDGCFNIGNGKTGGLVNGYQHCSLGSTSIVSLASEGTYYDPSNISLGVVLSSKSSAIKGSLQSVILGGSNSITDIGNFTTVIGSDSASYASHSQVIGSGLTVNHEHSTVMGSHYRVAPTSGTSTSTSIHQFSAFYDNGFRFMLGGSNSGQNTYFSQTPNSAFVAPGFAASPGDAVLATQGHVWVGKSTVIEGNLEVKGSIGSPIINDTGAACSGANEGAQKYNKAMKRMEFCNGTSWTLF